MQSDSDREAAATSMSVGDGLDLLDVALPLVQNAKLLILGPLLIGLGALGVSSLLTPTFTARTMFLPPQQQQTATMAALSQLGVLAGLANSATSGIKSPGEQYVALLQSTTVADRLLDRFQLVTLYESEFRFQARKELADRTQITLGRKDGLITLEVDDADPKRSADLANAYVEELNRLTSQLTLTEAQQRRAFFEEQLKQTRDQLTKAQQDLEASGFSQGALNAEPRAAAENYARLKAELTAAEVRLQTLRRTLVDGAAEVQQQQSTTSALRGQLAALETRTGTGGNSEYIGKYREFKYQEALFELFARQYELARLDEARDGATLQVIDVATAPEWKSKPKRALIAIAATLMAALLLAGFVVVRHALRLSARQPATAQKLSDLRAAMRRR